MESVPKFSLKWNNYSHHIATSLEDLRGDDNLTDVTLSCEGKRLKAHKLLLSACSVYFKETFRENPCQHPVIILKGVSFRDLEAIVSFIYNGEVHISQDNLKSFLETAELLQVEGLTDAGRSQSVPTSKLPVETSTASLSGAEIREKPDAPPPEDPALPPRPPTPKRRRITDPSNFVSTSLEPIPSVAIPGPSGVSSSTGGLLNPQIITLPSTSMMDPSEGLMSTNSNSSFAHNIIKFEKEGLDGTGTSYDMDFDNNNLLQGNDTNSLMPGGLDGGDEDRSQVLRDEQEGNSDSKLFLSLTNKKKPKLTVDGCSYLLQAVNKQGVEQWRCITYWKTKCKGRLRKFGDKFSFTALHSDTCDQ